MRPDGRKNDELRKTAVTVEFISSAPGSVLIEIGKTRVICAATIEEKVPSFLKDQKRGWVTAEYAMLPRSTPVRTSRESSTGRPNGRTQEIQRLIGRSLRAVTDMEALGERTVWLDCDVIEADGGTRTASITGAFLAFRLAVGRAMGKGLIQKMPIKDYLAAISVGMVGGDRRLDLCYAEDCGAQVDMNVVMTGSGKLVEIQSTAEEAPFSRDDLNEMLSLAEKGIKELVAIQKGIVEGERP
ncbi:MAG: ribonuclease PH [Actinomycetota bacterium]|nr:ribonuclease PH [Actinomycetota bacterium]